jgi:NTE family protein
MEEIENQIKQLQDKLNDLKKQVKTVKNLVFSGGSSKGFSYLGVIKAFYEFGILDHLEEISGTSIGALFAVIVSLKMTPNDIISIFMEIDLNWLHNLNSDSILHLINKYGLDNGNNLEKFLESVVSIRFPNLKPSEVTFLDLWTYNPIKINITGSKVYQGIIEPQLYNHILTPKMSIVKALRISMSIPPLFSPINDDTGHLVDGGIINNYPIDFYKDKLDSTIGVLCSEKIINEKCKNVVDIYKSIIVYMITKETLMKKNKYLDNTIIIESSIQMFHIFNLSQEEKSNIINLGYQLTKQYLVLKGYSLKEHDVENENKNKINIVEFVNSVRNSLDKDKDKEKDKDKDKTKKPNDIFSLINGSSTNNQPHQQTHQQPHQSHTHQSSHHKN